MRDWWKRGEEPIVGVNWFRVRDAGAMEPLAGAKGKSTYQPTADDVGARISAQVYDMRSPEVCRWSEVGPITPDPAATRALAAGLKAKKLVLSGTMWLGKTNGSMEAAQREERTQRVELEVTPSALALTAIEGGRGKTTVPLQPQVDAISVHPTDPRRLVVSISSGQKPKWTGDTTNVELKGRMDVPLEMVNAAKRSREAADAHVNGGAEALANGGGRGGRAHDREAADIQLDVAAADRDVACTLVRLLTGAAAAEHWRPYLAESEGAPASAKGEDAAPTVTVPELQLLIEQLRSDLASSTAALTVLEEQQRTLTASAQADAAACADLRRDESEAQAARQEAEVALETVREESKTAEAGLRATLAARDATVAALEEAVETHKGVADTHAETHRAAVESHALALKTTTEQHEAHVKATVEEHEATLGEVKAALASSQSELQLSQSELETVQEEMLQVSSWLDKVKVESVAKLAEAEEEGRTRLAAAEAEAAAALAKANAELSDATGRVSTLESELEAAQKEKAAAAEAQRENEASWTKAVEEAEVSCGVK